MYNDVVLAAAVPLRNRESPSTESTPVPDTLILRFQMSFSGVARPSADFPPRSHDQRS